MSGICPKCGKPVLDFDGPERDVWCSPIQSPDCWRIDQEYDHGLEAWVLTHDPGEEAPSAAEFRDRVSVRGQQGDER